MDERRAARWLLGAMTAACAAVLVAPVLAATAHPAAASFFYLLFLPVCHQIPARSFHWLGFPLALCARCTGLLAGAWLATMAARLARPIRASHLLFLIAACFLLIDVATELAGLRPALAGMRFLTGTLAGVAGGGWLGRAVHGLGEEWKQHCAARLRAQRAAA